MNKKIIIFVLLFVITIYLSGCGSNKKNNSNKESSEDNVGLLSYSDIFTERDLKQEADTNSNYTYIVSDNEDINITSEGTYVINGSSKSTTIYIDVTNDEKVQLVLDNLTIQNDNTPCIYVKNADKVFITIVGNNNLSVTNEFSSNVDAVIFSKDDLVINGTGTLNIESKNNGITSKDDLKITGGNINITSENDALEANNSICIADGNITINSKKDGIHSEYSEDDSLGYVYIGGGNINITANDDAIHATTIIQIDDGDINLNAHEGLEATYTQINGGSINITATDDGINAANKSSSYSATVEINGGYTKINMGQGDTDAIDSNGTIIINGGTINITANSPFDYDKEAKYTGGTIIVNGVETTTITNQMMGGNMEGPGQNFERGFESNQRNQGPRMR